MPLVSVARSGFSSPEIKKGVYELLGKIDVKTRNVASILIKTNACFYWNSSTGQTTDLRVISAVIDWLRDRFGENITIKIGEADASAMKVKRVFEVLNYVALARQKRVELVNLSEGERFEKEVTVATKKIVLPFSKTILDTDMVVNVPKMKSHPITTMTCCLKNVYGMIYEPYKYQYHSRLNQVIVAANKIVRPDLNVVDALVVAGRHPFRLGSLLAGTDPLAVDSVSAKIMGCQPSKITHLALAGKERVGQTRDITVVGEDPERLRAVFPRRNVSLEMKSATILLALLSFYSRIVGDIVPPAMEK
jgi:uncharacterized protein (DUF362 family)